MRLDGGVRSAIGVEGVGGVRKVKRERVLYGSGAATQLLIVDVGKDTVRPCGGSKQAFLGVIRDYRIAFYELRYK